MLKYYIDKYNLLFVYPVEFESHGNITTMVLKFALIGIFFFQFIISNLFIKIFHDKDYAIYATLLYIVISIFIYYGMKNFFLSSSKEKKETIFDRFLTQTRIRQLFFHRSQSNFGDSYNDLGMIEASKAGFLFRTTDKIKNDYPNIPAFTEYSELLAAIKDALKK